MQAYLKGEFRLAASTFGNPVWRGNAWYRAGDYRQAVAAYEQETSATAHYNRGNALVQLGELAAAKEAYLAALAIEPRHEDALYNLSLLQGGESAAPAKATPNNVSRKPEQTPAEAVPLPPAPPVLLLEQRLRKEALRRELIKVEEPW